MSDEVVGPDGSALSDSLGPAPWADDVEAWLESHDLAEIEECIQNYARIEVHRAVAAERERWSRPAFLWPVEMPAEVARWVSAHLPVVVPRDTGDGNGK